MTTILTNETPVRVGVKKALKLHVDTLRFFERPPMYGELPDIETDTSGTDGPACTATALTDCDTVTCTD